MDAYETDPRRGRTAENHRRGVEFRSGSESRQPGHHKDEGTFIAVMATGARRFIIHIIGMDWPRRTHGSGNAVNCIAAG